MSSSKVFNDLFLTGELSVSNTIKFANDTTKITRVGDRLFIKDIDFNNKSLSDCIIQVLNGFYNFSQVSSDNSTLSIGSNSKIYLGVDNYPHSLDISGSNIQLGSNNTMSNITISGVKSQITSTNIDFISSNTIGINSYVGDTGLLFNAQNTTNANGIQDTTRIVSGWTNSNSLAQNSSYFSLQTHHNNNNNWNDTLYVKANHIGICNNTPSEALSVSGNIEVRDNGYIYFGGSQCKIRNNGGNIIFEDNYNQNINLSQLVSNFVLLNDGIDVFSHFSRNSDRYFVISGEKVPITNTDGHLKYLLLDSNTTKVSGDLDISGNLVVSGNINLTENATITTVDNVQFKSLGVTNRSTFTGGIDVSGTAIFDDQVTFKNDLMINSDIVHEGVFTFRQQSDPLQYTRLQLDSGNNDLRFTTNLFPTGVSVNELFDLHGRFSYANPFTVYTDSGLRFGSKGGFNIIDISPTGQTIFREDVVFQSTIATNGNLDVYNQITIGQEPKIKIYRDTSENQLRFLTDSKGIRFDIPGQTNNLVLDASGMLHMHNFNFTGDIYKNGILFGGVVQHFKYTSDDTLGHLERKVAIGKPQAQVELDVSGSLMVSKDLSVEGSIYNDENVYIGFQCLGIGIGKPNPIKHLDVSGNMAITGAIVSHRNLKNDTVIDLSDNEIIMKTNNSWCHLDNDDYTLKVGNMDMISIVRDKAGEENRIIFNRMSKACDFIVDASGVRNAFKIDGANGKIAFGKEVPRVQLDISGVDAIQLPVGDNSDRPTGPFLDGMIRYNKELNQPECYVNGQWANLASGTNFGGIFNTVYNNLNNTYLRANNDRTIDIMADSTQNMTLSADTNRMDKKLSFINSTGEITGDTNGVLITGRVGIGDNPEFSLDVSGTDGIMIPNGTIAQRPTNTRLNGCIRYNTEYNQIEGYANGEWKNLANFGSGQSHAIIDDNNDTNIVVFDNDTLEFTVLSQQKMFINNTDIKVNLPIKFDTSDSKILHNNNMVEIISDASGVYVENYMGINTVPSVALDISANTGIRMPKGTTSERPDIVNMEGTIRYNTTTKEIEGYTAEGWIVMTDTSCNLISDKDRDTHITINESDRIDFGVAGTNRLYMDTSGIYVNHPIRFSGSKSNITYNTLGDGLLDISGNNGIRINNTDYIQDNRLGLGMEPRMNIDCSGVDGIMIPRGTTAERPNFPDIEGTIRYNTTTKEIEGYTAEGWIVMTDTSCNLISDKDRDTHITINESDRIDFGVAGTNRLYMDTSGIYVNHPIRFSGSKSNITYNTLGDGLLDISGNNGIRINNTDYIQDNRLGLGMEPRMNIDCSGVDGIMIPRGTTAERPNFPDIEGTIRYNTTTKEIEGYTAEGWVVMTDTSCNLISDKDTDTHITINESNRIDMDVGGVNKVIIDNNGISLADKLVFNSDSYILTNTTTNHLDISGTNGICINNNNFIKNNRLGLGIEPRLTVDCSGIDGIMIPRGTTLERPELGDMNGIIRYNQTTGHIEGYTHNGWIPMTDISLNFINSSDNTTSVEINDVGRINFKTNDIQRMVLREDGKIGVGKSIPNATLDIVGDVKVSTDLDMSGKLTVGGNIGLGVENPVVAFDTNKVDAIQLPYGTSSERPVTGLKNGMIRYNTEVNRLESYINDIWCGINNGKALFITTSIPVTTIDIATVDGIVGKLKYPFDSNPATYIDIEWVSGVAPDAQYTSIVSVEPTIGGLVTINDGSTDNSGAGVEYIFKNPEVHNTSGLSSGGSGTAFSGLTDTPSGYTANKMVFTKTSGDGLEYRDNKLTTIGDVDITNISDNHFIKYDAISQTYKNTILSTDHISNIDTSGVIHGSLLRYDINHLRFGIVNSISVTQLSEISEAITNHPNKFLKVNSNADGISYNTIAITDLTDINIDGANQSQVLKYNNGTSKWDNGFVSSLEISDMPNAYIGKQNNLLSVNNTETGYELVQLGLVNMTDITFGTPLNGQVLTYDTGDSTYKPLTIPIQNKAVADITDIVSAGATDGQVLVFSSANSDYRFIDIPVQDKAIGDITDIVSVGATGGQVLTFDAVNSDYRFTTIPIQDKAVADITDIVSAGVTDGQVLTFDAVNSDYRFKTIPVQDKAVGDITDIVSAGATDGQVLVFNSANNDYRFISIPVQNKAISDITDITIGTVTDGQVLTFDAVNSDYRFKTIPVQNKAVADITDIVSAGATDGQVLTFSNANNDYRFTTIPIQDKAVADITDIVSAGATDGQLLSYDANTTDYRFIDISLNNLADVITTGASNGDILTYNSATNKYQILAPAIQNKSVADITDISVANIGNNKVLTYNGTSYEFLDVPRNISELSDVDVTGVYNDAFLRYNVAQSKWVIGGSSTTIGNLDDCNTVGVANGDTLIYSNITNKYETKANSFFNLTDTPGNILGRNNHTFFVKNDGTGIESRRIRTSDIENIEFDQTKDGYFLMYSNADAGYVLTANVGVAQLDDLTDVTLAGLVDGNILKYDDSASNFIPAEFAFTGLDDTPSALTGNGGKYVKVNAGGTLLEFGDGTASDERIKKDIVLLDGCLDKLQGIRNIKFKYTNIDGDNRDHIGFIAQDFEKILPEVVGEQDGYKTIAYNETIPLLCGAIQELSSKTSKLEEENVLLRERLEKIEKALGI